jgi:ribonuclease P protein component
VVASNDEQHARIGIVAGKVVGGAVERNRAKRRIRASLEPHLAHLPADRDLIFLARKPMDQAGFAEICAAVQLVLRKAGLLDGRS